MRQPCLTEVVKLFYICDKALSYMWKSFLTIVKQLLSRQNRADALQISRPFKKYLSLGSQRDNNKNQRSNGNIFYIRKSIRSS